jgi:hypothetical protein
MYAYRYKHYRSNHERFTDLLDDLAATGATLPNKIQAITVCVMEEVGTQRQLGVGAAFCSDKDQFSKRKGRQLARDRAMHNRAFREMVAETTENE